MQRIAVAQRGLVTRRQARSAGISNSAISRRVASGRWRRLHQGVLLVAPQSVGLLTAVTAARLWAGDGLRPRGVVTGLTAARVWGLDDSTQPAAIELTLPRAVRRGQPPGIRLRWTALPSQHVVSHRGIPCTTPERVIADLAARLDHPSVLVLADAALRLGLCTEAQLSAAAGPNPRDGARALLISDGRAESPFESRVRSELLSAGVPAPVLQHVVRDADGRFLGRVDFAWPQQRLIVEADGAGVHASAQAFRDDVRRQNALVAAGWTVLRFTWGDLGRIAPRVAAALSSTRRRSA